MKTRISIGQEILEEIVKQGMVRVAHPEIDEPIVFVWNANAAEQIEAVVRDVLKRSGNEL